MAEADEISAGRAPESGLESGLRRIAARISADAAGATGLRRLSGGATQEIWRFDLVTGAAPAPAILRRAPGGREISGFAVGPETEAALIRAAEAAGVPGPPGHYVLRPEDGLGQGFVMGFVEGETLGGRIVKSEAFAAIRPLLARQCGRILARIHSIDPNEFPSLERTEPQTLISRWLDAYRAAAAGAAPGPWRFPQRQSDSRSGRRARRTGLGAGSCRRSDGRSGLDLRQL